MARTLGAKNKIDLRPIWAAQYEEVVRVQLEVVRFQKAHPSAQNAKRMRAMAIALEKGRANSLLSAWRCTAGIK